MTLGKEIPVKDFNKWLHALYSGEYKQGRGSFERPKNHFCCIGVGCLTLIPKEKILRENGLIVGVASPNAQPFAPNWFSNLLMDFEYKTGVRLWVLNDNDEFSFPEIAMCLELVYVHKALD